MKFKIKNFFTITAMSVAVMSVTGCAELAEYNAKVAKWAGEQIQIRDMYKQEFASEVTSKRDIDSLYTRIKREFRFLTEAEDNQLCGISRQCRDLRKHGRETSGWAHDRVPGVSYHLAQEFDNPNRSNQDYFIDIQLNKDGSTTNISLMVRGDEAYYNKVKNRLLKVAR